MRLTYAVRQRAPLTLIIGRKSQELKRQLRQVVKRVAEQAHAIAIFFCPVDTGFMQRHLRLRYTSTRLGFDLGWQAVEFRAAGKVFYPPFVVEGTSRQAPQNPLRPAINQTSGQLTRECTLVFRKWATTRKAA